MSNQSITEFYAGKSVFITGGTGFLGKVLIEKLLYSCPDIDNIYILIREKKGETVDERLKYILNEPLFQRLQDERPKNLKKLVAVPGNISSPGLGISKEHKEILIEKISIVIHAAATIKLDEPLKEAWTTIVDGTRRMLELSRGMKRIEVFIHISTAYSNLDREVIEEILYPAPASVDDIQQLLKQDITKKETTKIIGTRANTYTFTKAIAENLVAENQHNVPTVIIRPSIVGASINEPIKGWLQNWYAATTLMISTAKGLNRLIYGRGNNLLDLIPVDYVINLIIAAGAKNYRSRFNIYNISSSDSNPINMERFLRTASNEVVKRKLHYMPMPQWYIFTRNSWIISIVTIFFQIIPAYLGDLYRRISGKPAMYRKLQYQIIRTRLSQQLVTNNSWIIRADRARKLFSSLSFDDRKIFPFDPTTIDWSQYIKDYVVGVEKYLVKQAK